MKANNRAGFTLVELLVATLLLTLVMTAVYALFSTVIQSWRSVESDDSLHRKARHAQRLLQRDYANLFGGAAHLMEGTGDSLSFYVVSAPMASEGGTTPQLLQIRYRFDNDTGELLRTEAIVTAPLPSPGQIEAGTNPTPEGLDPHAPQVIAQDLQHVSFTYVWIPQPEGAWWRNRPEPVSSLIAHYHRPTWGLPQAVNVTLEFSPTEGASVAQSTLQLFTRGPSQRRERYQLENILGDAL